MRKNILLIIHFSILFILVSCVPEPTATPFTSPTNIVTLVPTQTEIPKWHTEMYITCERVNVSMLNETEKKLETRKIMKNSLGEEIARDAALVDPDGYANLGWNPTPGYIGEISWIIQIIEIEPDNETGIILAQFKDSATLDCRSTPSP